LILNGIENAKKEKLENIRLLSYFILAPHSKNLKIQDILKFEWDKEIEINKESLLNNEEIKILENKANELIKLL